MRSFAVLPILCLLFLLGSVSAWPWPHHGEVVQRRADSTTAADKATTGAAHTSAETASQTNTASATDDKSETGTATNTGTAKETGTSKASKTDESSSTEDSSSTSVDPRLPAGGVSMLTPPNGATSYYKIGQYVTFVWNYTSLSVTPSAVNVLASCSVNSATYTISSNMSVEQTGSVVWDTKQEANATSPLLTATYTLYVVDVDKSIGDTASAGHLGSQNGYSFGMYLPQAYTPLKNYICATCNSALSETERAAIKFAFGMAAITIATFTWFAGDFGVFST